MQINKHLFVIAFIVGVVFITGCNEEYIPKPRGYFRINLPKAVYKTFNPNDCNFKFDIHQQAFIIPDREGLQEPCWHNIYYPKFKSTIHLSYKTIEKNLNEMIEDSRSLVYKHTVKASDIKEFPIIDDSLKVYGLLYELEGEAASLMQFYLTDSINHFVRGALYFNVKIGRAHV